MLSGDLVGVQRHTLKCWEQKCQPSSLIHKAWNIALQANKRKQMHLRYAKSEALRFVAYSAVCVPKNTGRSLYVASEPPGSFCFIASYPPPTLIISLS